MKFTLTKFMMIIYSMVPLMKNPMSMGFMLMTQTMLMVLMLNKVSYSSWFTMITFLMMIGGLLIIFTYMCSITSNEKFKFKINLTLVALLLITLSDELMFDNQINENQNMNFSMNIELSLIKVYNSKSMMMTLMMVIYLLITMISVTKIVGHHKGPLRSYNK